MVQQYREAVQNSRSPRTVRARLKEAIKEDVGRRLRMYRLRPDYTGSVDITTELEPVYCSRGDEAVQTFGPSYTPVRFSTLLKYIRELQDAERVLVSVEVPPTLWRPTERKK